MDQDAIAETADQLIVKGNTLPRELVPPGAFAEWQSQVLRFLTTLLGPTDVYTRSFKERCRFSTALSLEAGLGILCAVRGDAVAGRLTKISTLVSAEVFADFLDMAKHLIDVGYKDAAASLCGAVLENGLRRIARSNRVLVRDSDDLSGLNQKCAQAGVYTRLVQKKIQVWTDIRNNADHGDFGQYTLDDVKEMYEGVSKFLVEYLK